MSLELLILDGPEAGRRLQVGANAFTFGRAPSAAVSIPYDNFISGNHLSVQAEAQGVLLTDMRSTNGTFLNGQRIMQAVASIGDMVKIGSLSMQVVVAEPAPGGPVLSAATRPVQGMPPPAFQAFTPPTLRGSGPPSGKTTLVRTVPLEPPPAPAPSAPSPPQQPAPFASELPPMPILPPGAGMVPLEPVSEAALRILTSAFLPLFCMLDTGADPVILQELAQAHVDLPPHCLYQGGSATVANLAPYLLPLSSGGPLLRALVEKGWGRNWSCFFTSPAPFEELQGHFRKFLMAQVQGGGEVYFRFYEPKVLRDFLPTANASERDVFFGPVDEWLLESPDKAVMLRIRNSPGGLVTSSVSLADGGT